MHVSFIGGCPTQVGDPGLGHPRMMIKKDGKGWEPKIYKKNKNSDDFDEPMSWQCEFCKKEFDSEKGCLFHENIHCTKRRNKKGYSARGSRLLQEELEDSEDSYDSYDSEDDDIICYRCGRPGHKKPACYARSHKKGYPL